MFVCVLVPYLILPRAPCESKHGVCGHFLVSTTYINSSPSPLTMTLGSALLVYRLHSSICPLLSLAVVLRVAQGRFIHSVHLEVVVL